MDSNNHIQNRAKKLQIAVRRNERIKRLPSFLGELSQLLNYPVDESQLVDLERTDELQNLFFSLLERCVKNEIRCFKKTWVAKERKAVEMFMSTFNKEISHDFVILFRGLSEICGAIVIKPQLLLSHALDLISCDQEDLMILSQETVNGLLLEFTLDYVVKDDEIGGRKEQYILTIWGDDWVKVAQEVEKRHRQ